MPQFFGFAPVAIRGPKPLPIIGAAKRFYDLLNDSAGLTMRLRDQGSVVTLVDRNPAVVCVFGADRNREVLSNPSVFQHDETLFRGPPGSAMDEMRFSTVTINGDLHRRHRALMMPAFQKSALDGYAEDIVSVTRTMLARWPVGQVAHVDTLCRDAALAMAMKCLYGLDVSDEAHALGQMAADFVETVIAPSTILLPFNLPGMAYRRVVRLAEELSVRIRALIARKRAMGGEPRDAMGLLMAARDEEGKSLSDAELFAEAISLFIAGHETTAMTLAWTLFLLERHPDVLAALMSEIEGALGDRDPGPGDLPNLPITDRVLKESMRVLAPIPTLFLRVCAASTTLEGYELPKGANVLVSPLATHHDPKLYPEPERFVPDRWIGLTATPYAYLPFGAGPRTCLGMLFAERALRLMLPMIVRRFHLSIPEGARIDRLTRGNILQFRRGLPMKVEDARSAVVRPPRPIAGDIHDFWTP